MPSRSHSAAFARHAIATLAIAVAVATCRPAICAAQTIDPMFPITNGQVTALVAIGDTLYFGGAFTWTGYPNGGMVALDAVTGAVVRPWPRVHAGRWEGDEAFFAAPHVSIPDGDGGCYVGGWFQYISGRSTTGLAHIRADGTLDDWGATMDGSVRCMARVGSKVFVGGRFTTLGGQPRNGIGALDAVTGALDPWDAHASGSVELHEIATDGTRLFVCGVFGSIGGQIRNGLAALDVVTGSATSWNPGPNAAVSSIAVGDGVIYAGGDFTTIGGQSRRGVAALDPFSGAANSWDAELDLAGIRCLATSGGLLYMSGPFTSIGGTPRKGLGAVDATTAQVANWAPDLGYGQALTMSATEARVYFSGYFSSVNGAPRRFLAAVDAGSGALTNWNPGADQPVEHIAAYGSRVFVSGLFAGCGGDPCTGLAALDLRTGEILPWRPALDGNVAQLATDGTRVYVGGSFRHVDGQPRGGLAAFDASTGGLEAWNPGGASANSIDRLATNGSRVYVHGDIKDLGGSGLREFAALDPVTGLASAWNPTYASTTSYRYISGLLATPSRVYLSGEFSSVNEQPASAVCAVDPESGALLPWDAGVTRYVDAVALHDATLYLTGGLSTAGGAPAEGVAAVDTASGLAVPWVAYGRWAGHSLAATDSMVYMGFNGGHLDPGHRRNAVVAFDPSTGTVKPWYPHFGAWDYQLLTTLAPHGRDLLVGGTLSMMAGEDFRPGLARVRPTDVSPPAVHDVTPGAGDALVIGSHRTLSWQAVDDQGIASSDLYLSRQGPAGPWELVAAAVTGPSAYEWTVTPPASNDCWLRVDARDHVRHGSSATAGPFTIAYTTAVPPVETPAPLALEAPAPNPLVRGTGRLSFAHSARGLVRLAVLDLQGREVVVLVDGELPAGRHAAALPSSGLSAGLYFVRLSTPQGAITRRLAVIR